MNLYIKCIDGQIIDHPVTFENLCMVYGHFDGDNIPANYVKFKRAAKPPILFPYKYTEAIYVLVGDVVEEVYLIKDMTDGQKQVKIDAALHEKLYDSWVFNVDKCMWQAPVSYPDDGNKYMWNEETQSWIAIQST